MKIGFTGTRKGMTDAQKKYINKVFRLRKSIIEEGHHGDCIGADADFHNIALLFNIPIIIHPPIKNEYRAFCRGAKAQRPKKGYIPRDEDIVNETDILIGTPKRFHEEFHSGTWTTIRYAVAQGKMVIIVYPDGSIEVKNRK